MKGTWEKIADVPAVPRSSASANVVAGTLYIFGGEDGGASTKPRRPGQAGAAGNAMHAVALPSSGAPADYYVIPAKPVAAAAPGDKKSSEGEGKGKGVEGAAAAALALGNVPAARVGHASAVIGHRIFMFGGRHGGGGGDSGDDNSMAPLDEGGRVWIFDTRTRLWSYLDPARTTSTVEVPAPRSHHASVATDKPRDFDTTAAARRRQQHHSQGAPGETWREWALGDTDEVGTPQRPIVGNVAERATDADSDGYGTLIVHGGCLADGRRTSDVWAFDIHSRVWQKLPDAPGAGQAAPALALSRSRLYRFSGGVDATSAESGQLDYLELVVDSFNDEFSAGEVSIAARGGWQSLIQGKENVGYKETDPAETPFAAATAASGYEGGGGGGGGDVWPGRRSAAVLEAITVGGGREFLVLMLGEKASSSDTQQQRFYDDVWAFQVPSQGMSPASLADTVFSVVGRRGPGTGGRRGGGAEGRWSRVTVRPHDHEDDVSAAGPGPRAYLASATMGDLEENGIVVWGGMDAQGRRLGDGWIFRLD
ncbi:hypothetical protein B0T26DRAFT_636625 [Lasiosphaeria miniovina]|uniref:Nitrile-specifier protein 5 n=1 Tax=Lasiosphaeria miniovina TaxID=1954250 RepID=A0AA40B797_9PEZI|nr:uncharacterized protein B0T26DRAFT_636625 [Lasiosphaeria miniovina]KAK0728648.1 hypothetical protein B0T26DRAFT_636625 [Lasiosphaeria miniovina]